MEIYSSHRCFGGIQQFYSHWSEQLSCQMNFGIFLPSFNRLADLPVLFLLAGREGNQSTFAQKSGCQRLAADLGLILVTPDTSPRGQQVAHDPANRLGHGASYYFDASKPYWQPHYRMESYVSKELPQLLSRLGCHGPRGICGHSMGGHGALINAFKHPDVFSSVSGIAPVCNLDRSPRGREVLTSFLQPQDWSDNDASQLLESRGWPGKILIDVGDCDNYFSYLATDVLLAAAASNEGQIDLRVQHGYDHSYYFVASFIADHLTFHWQQLTDNKKPTSNTTAGSR